MRVERTSLNEMTVTFTADDDLYLSVRDAVGQAQNDMNVWNLFLILPTDVYAAERVNFDKMGFIPAGNLSVDNKTLVKMRLAVRRSSDGGTLAVETPTNGPTSEEVGAIKDLLDRNPDLARVWKKYSGGTA